MNIVLDVDLKGQVKENDMLVIKNGKWTVVKRDEIFGDFMQKQKEQEEEIKAIKEDLKNLAKIIKEK